MATIIEYKINKPYYATAGTQFNWPLKDGVAGIGLAADKLKGKSTGMLMNIDSKGNKMIGDIQRLYQWYLENSRSVQIIKGKKIIVFPLSMFSVLKQVGREEMEELNLKLF